MTKEKPLKQRIREEMMVDDKHKAIKELADMRIWSYEKIKLRWELLEAEQKK